MDPLRAWRPASPRPGAFARRRRLAPRAHAEATPPKEPVAVVPDWLCEILSPSTASYDSIVKRRFYAEIGVAYLWYVDPPRKQLEVCRLVEGKWLQLGVHGADEKVRAEPFEAVELDIAEWWEGVDEDEGSGEGAGEG